MSIRNEGRNREIFRRYVAGEKQPSIAREFGISNQRVSQIIAIEQEQLEHWRLPMHWTSGPYGAYWSESYRVTRHTSGRYSAWCIGPSGSSFIGSGYVLLRDAVQACEKRREYLAGQAATASVSRR